MERADVIIVGGGLAGCSAAWHLAPDHDVLVLEQGSQPGAEASAQNAGMVRRLGEDPYERALALRTAAWMADPGPDWSDAPPSRVVGAVLGLVHDPGDLHDAVAHVRAAGVRVDAVPLAEIGAIAPALTGSPLRAAWHVPDERVADAHALLTGFLRGARRHGARVRCRVAVQALLRDGDRCVGVRTSHGNIHAEHVVLAAGAWCAALAAGAQLDRPLIPLRRSLVRTAPHPASRPDHPWCWLDDVGLYLRPEAGGWLCSPCDERAAPPAPGPGSSGPVEVEVMARLGAKLDRWTPALGGARFTGGWTGLRTFAPDRRPLLGADPEVPGLWWVAGLGGFGVTCSYAVGEVLSAWMAGRDLPWIRPRGVSPGRPFPRRWTIRATGERAGAQLVDVGSGPSAQAS